MKTPKEQKKSLPNYSNPPVIEVVCGIRFKKIEKFKVPHLGLFWQQIREAFPVCQHAPPLGFSPEQIDLSNGFPFPLPRIWFINEQKNGLIQLQNDRFHYNWRKIQQDESYPRYQTVINAFTNNLAIFQKYLQDENLGKFEPIECELTYLNHIFKGEGWESVTDLNQIVPDYNWFSKEKEFLPEPINIGWRTTFVLPEDRGRLVVKFDQGNRKVDNYPVFILNFTAQGLGADKSMDSIWSWFELAHEWIVRGFTDLTHPEIQKTIWDRTDKI